MKHERLPEPGEPPPSKVAKRQSSKNVVFLEGDQLENVHYFDPTNGHEDPTLETCAEEVEGDSSRQTSKLTEELTILSTLHGRARRELRDISKHDLQTVMKYGIKTRGNTVNGELRWKFEFGNTVFITDEHCTKEITCYKKAIRIEKAKITQEMWRDHEEAAKILKDDPHLCTTHSIIIIDQSGSMRHCDVDCFRSRSDAAFGTFALDYIAEQLYQQEDGFFVDAITVIEMNSFGSILFHKEPLDWILFNKVLEHMESAKPRSHGNYVESLELAEKIIEREVASFEDLDTDDIPAFTLVFISDGKPSDTLPYDEERRESIMCRLANLELKLTFLGMGIGAVGSDFEEMRRLADIMHDQGSEATDGTFVHAGLNPTAISTTLTSVATAMTTTRNDLLTKKDERITKTEKVYTMRGKRDKKCQVRRETGQVSRYVYDPRESYPWRRVEFFDKDAAGFEVEKDPFGRGAERLAHMFYEMKLTDQGWKRVGRPMVAKESRFLIRRDEETKERFHTSFCKVQHKAKELAIKFNEAVNKAPLLQPEDDEVSKPPPIVFLKCSVYEYMNSDGILCGLLVENFLNGKFTKYNGNNGYVKKDGNDSVTINLAIGEVKLSDFVQAFSHWVYQSSGHTMLVCDLQGILDLEGIRPIFRLTDPVICSKSRKVRYGKTDIGMKGIRQFCRFHRCNKVCRGLNLPAMRAN